MKHVFVPLDIRPDLDHHWIDDVVFKKFYHDEILPTKDLVSKDVFSVLGNFPKIRNGDSNVNDPCFLISPFKINLNDIEQYENLNKRFEKIVDDEVVIYLTMSEHTAILLGREFWIRALPNFNIIISDVWEPCFLSNDETICISKVFNYVKKYSQPDVPFYVSFIKPNASSEMNTWFEEHDIPAKLYNFDYFILDTFYQSGIENSSSLYDFKDMNIEEYIDYVFSSEKNKDFVCLNRSYKFHRPMLINDLYVNNMLTNSYFSLGEIYEVKDSNLPVVKDLGMPILADGEPESNIIDGKMNHDSVGNVEWAKNSKLFLSTESFMFNNSGKLCNTEYKEYPIKFISEKVHKPLAWGMPFVVFGCQGALEHMRSVGFKTFEPYIDETYDTIEDPQERYNLALKSAIEFVKKDFPMEEIKNICRNNLLWFYSKDFYIKLNDNLVKSITDDYIKFRLVDDWEFRNR